MWCTSAPVHRRMEDGNTDLLQFLDALVPIGCTSAPVDTAVQDGGEDGNFASCSTFQVTGRGVRARTGEEGANLIKKGAVGTVRTSSPVRGKIKEEFSREGHNNGEGDRAISNDSSIHEVYISSAYE